jgi:prepilin-type N-terminal cleavage/methylation domain-containing protein
MTMKTKKRGFTLVEMVVVMVIALFMCLTLAMMLSFSYKFTIRVNDQKKKSGDLINFKLKLNEQLMGASSGYYIGTAADYIAGTDVKFDLWTTIISGVQQPPDPSTWNNKVTRFLCFYYFDRDLGQTIRCRYSFNRNDSEGHLRTDGLGDIIYTVWDAKYAAGILLSVESPMYNDLNYKYAEIVMKDVKDFQVTNHRRNLVDSDIYWIGTNTFASDVLLQVYIDIANDDVIYNSGLFFMNRDSRRRYKIG